MGEDAIVAEQNCILHENDSDCDLASLASDPR